METLLISYGVDNFIAGNASLASKIKEISDLRRTAPSQPQTAVDEQTKVAAVAANAITAATALGKRRRAEHNTAVQIEVPDKRTSKRCGAKAAAPTSSTVVPTADSSIPVTRKVQSEKALVEIVADRSEQSNESAATAVKNMHAEIARLTEENNVLLSEQFTRETDIRIEVRSPFAFFVDINLYYFH